MANGRRKCLICGKEYEYCPHCGKGDEKETWRYLYDDAKCHKIFKVLSDFAFNHITKDVAANQLRNIGINDMTFTDGFKSQVEDILGNKTTKDDKPKIETPKQSGDRPMIVNMSHK